MANDAKAKKNPAAVVVGLGGLRGGPARAKMPMAAWVGKVRL